MTLSVKTDQKRQIIDITGQVEAALSGDGLVNLLIKHTTAAITLADLDPGTDQDYLQALQSLTPNAAWQHPHDPAHFPDHLWSSLIGASLTLPYKNGKLTLGTWQRLIVIELDGPRERQIKLTAISINKRGA